MIRGGGRPRLLSCILFQIAITITMARSGASSLSLTLSYCTTNSQYYRPLCDTIAIRTVSSPSGTGIYCHPFNCPVIALPLPTISEPQ